MPAKRLRTVACAGGATQDAALKVLASETAALDAAVHGGGLAAARRGWLTAHLPGPARGDGAGRLLRPRPIG